MTVPERPGVAKYRKKPIEVEAMQYRVEDGMDNQHALKRWGVHINHEDETRLGPIRIWITKGNAWGRVRPGDWVIKERDGHGFYPCTAEELEATYEPA